jgi:hypothetical protein
MFQFLKAGFLRAYAATASLAAVLLPAVLLPTGARAITISEIHYNPGPDGVEFIEIYNEDGETRDLSRCFFAQGIEYRFPGYEDGSPTFIRGKSYIVVAQDVDRALVLYPHLKNTNPLFPAVVGPFAGSLDNGGERIDLANPGGAIDVSLRYNNRGAWPSAADGTGHSLVLEDPDLDDPEKDENWTYSPLRGGSPGLANFGQKVYTEIPLAGAGEVWKFFRGTAEPSEPREAWRQLEYDASAWEEGPMPIGYGHDCYSGTVISGMQGTYVSLYFRKTIQVADPAWAQALLLRISYDDGFIAYLNGKEVARKNIAANRDAFDATASSTSRCTSKIDISIPDPASKLAAGTNVLAIQVHNRNLNDATCGVIPELIVKNGEMVGDAPKLDVDLNELHWTDAAPWLEIYNDQDAEQDLSGFSLTDDASQLRKFEFPPETKIGPHGFLVVEESQVVPAGIRFSSTSDKTLFLALSRPLSGRAPPEDVQVVDACRFQLAASPSTAGMSLIRHPDGKNFWGIARTPTRGGPNRLDVVKDVIVNEIMYHPFHPAKNDFVPGTDGFEKPEDQGEYVEIFNRGAEPVSMGGWAFTKGFQFTFPPGSAISAGQYLVVARDPMTIGQTYGLPLEQVFGPWHGDTAEEGAVLADSGERLDLVDEIGNVVDSVHYYDGGRWPKWADSRGSSLERIDPFADGSRPGNWDASDESGKAEWKHYTFTGRYAEGGNYFMLMLTTRGIVLIDNMKVTDPANANSPNYVKNGDFETPFPAFRVAPTPPAEGWMPDGTHIFSGVTTADKLDGNSCLKVIATGRGNNKIDCLRYYAPKFPANRNLLLEFDAKWVCGEGVVLTCGTWNSFAHNFKLEVPPALGSPGEENGVRRRLPSGNKGPYVERVRQSPVLPAASAPVVVTAEVGDPDGVKEVKFVYSIDAAAAAAVELPMLDDGAGEDEAAGDGVYTVAVPGQVNAKRVIFSIEALDSLDNPGRFPYDDRLRTHPYFLDPAAAAGKDLRHGIYIHGVAGAQGGVPDYRMLMTLEGASYLSSRHVMSNDLIDSSLVWNDRKIFYNIGTRYSNSPWTRAGGKSFVLQFGRDDLLQGYKKMKLDNRGNEINERVAYHLVRGNNIEGREPLPYPRNTYVRPYLNSGPVGSIMERMEVPGKEFVKRWWPNDSDGVLFKIDDMFQVSLPQGTVGTNREARVQYLGEDGNAYRFFFTHRTREKYDDFSGLIDLAKFFRLTGDAYNKGLFEKCNMEEMIRSWAISFNIDDWDTWGTTRGKNSSLYLPTIDGRWHLIGWDKDYTFTSSQWGLVPTNHAEVARLVNSPGGNRIHRSILFDMANRFFSADYVNKFFNEHYKDKDGKAITGIPSSAAGSANFVNSRLTSVIKPALGKQPNFEILTGGALEAATASGETLAIEGNAPLNVWTLVVSNSISTWLDPEGKVTELVLDAEDGDLTWTTANKWKTNPPLPIAPGVNHLTFAAFDSSSNPVGLDRVYVLRDVQWEAPAIQSVEPSQGPKAGGTPVVARGANFHVGAKLLIAGAAALQVAVDEAAGTISAVTPAFASTGPVEVKVQNIDGQSGALAAGFSYTGSAFNRGDVDTNGKFELTDAIGTLLYQFGGGSIPCLDAADVNDDGKIDLTDPILLLTYMYLAGDPPKAPFDPTGTAKGEDPTADDLGCTGSGS